MAVALGRPALRDIRTPVHHPDRPMIIGAHYDAGHASPVTSANPSENRLWTKADNELLMDDKIDHQIIKLRTYKGFNILQFDAKKGRASIKACL